MKLRLTGEWPPQTLWEEYPNWEYALDEEGEPDQDETTLRPSQTQRHVSADVAFTAGIAVQANGRKLSALIEMIDAEMTGINVFTSESDSWSVRLLGRPASWKCISNDWLPLSERGPVVLAEDANVFPLEVQFRLPLQLGGTPLSETIVPDGNS